MFLLNELLSPLTTPFVLLFSLRPRALDIVDFFRQFTVTVLGVGDVCSFAQMDVRKHGNPDWQSMPSVDGEPAAFLPTGETNQYTQGENGKTELSLMHFTKTNPTWQMTDDMRNFVVGVNRHAVNDLVRPHRNAAFAMPGGGIAPLPVPSTMANNLVSMRDMGAGYSSVVDSILNSSMYSSQMNNAMLFQHQHNQVARPAQHQFVGGGGDPHQMSNSVERMLQQVSNAFKLSGNSEGEGG